MFGTPLYVYHEIVHNRPVVERFRKRGVIFVDSVNEVPAGSNLLYGAMALRRPFGRLPPSAGCVPSTPPVPW